MTKILMEIFIVLGSLIDITPVFYDYSQQF